MKKLILFITILSVSLSAMEGPESKASEQKCIPSLAQLSAEAFTNKKTVNYVQQHENAAEYYTSFFVNNLPCLEADIACSIIAKLPKDILDANAQELKDMLCGDLQKNTEQSVKISPAVKAAIVKQITLEPTIVYMLFDSVLESTNSYIDKNVLGCILFEQYKEIQSWENIMELAAQGPITLEAAKIAIKSVDIMATPKKLETLEYDNLSAYNQDIFKQAFLELTTYPLFLHEASKDEPGDLIKNEKNYFWIEHEDSLEIYEERTKNCLATLPLKKNSVVVDCIASKGAQFLLLLTYKEEYRNCILCTLFDTKTKKILFICLQCPADYNDLYFDDKDHLIMENSFNNQLVIELPLFYFDDNNIDLEIARTLYTQQENNKNTTLSYQWGTPSSLEKLQRNSKKNGTEEDLIARIKAKAYLASQIDAVIKRNNPQEIKNYIKLLIARYQTVKNALHELTKTLEREKNWAECGNPNESDFFSASAATTQTLLRLISLGQELGLTDEIEQELAQENKEEE